MHRDGLPEKQYDNLRQDRSKINKTDTHSEATHISVLIVELHGNVGGILVGDVCVSEYLHLVEDERLVPGGVEGVFHGHRLLALVQEGHNRVGICNKKLKAESDCDEGRPHRLRPRREHAAELQVNP